MQAAAYSTSMSELNSTSHVCVVISTMFPGLRIYNKKKVQERLDQQDKKKNGPTNLEKFWTVRDYLFGCHTDSLFSGMNVETLSSLL